jgi:3'-phosphoadenosine 5'-phosphosulfate sulfotransferase (PAPS reductase)/FAD synthetase
MSRLKIEKSVVLFEVAPLTKALKGNSIWITGLRAEQSENRSDLSLLNTMRSLK